MSSNPSQGGKLFRNTVVWQEVGAKPTFKRNKMKEWVQSKVEDEDTLHCESNLILINNK